MWRRLRNNMPADLSWPGILFGLVILASLYVVSQYNFLLFHCIAEGFTIIVVLVVFMLLWNTRRFFDSGFFVLIGLGCLCAGILDLIHALVHEGMNVFAGDGANTALQAKTAGQAFITGSFLIAPLFLHRQINQARTATAYGLLLALALAAMFWWHVFPDCVVNGHCTTLFAKATRVLSGAMCLGAAALLIHRRRDFDVNVLRYLLVGVLALFVAELASATSLVTNGPIKVVGHLFQVVALYFIYKTFIEVGLTKPYDLLFKNLKQSEEALQRQQRYLETVIDSVGDGILACDAGGRVMLMNRPLREFCQIPPDATRVDLWAKMKGRLYHADGTTPLREDESPTFRALQGESVSNLELVIAPGGAPARTLLVNGRPLLDAAGRRLGAVIAVHDITDRKQAEDALRQNDRKFHALIEGLQEGIWVIDKDACTTFVNRRMAEMLGYAVEEMIGVSTFSFMDPRKVEMHKSRLERRKSGLKELYECEFLRKDGAVVHVRMAASPLYDERGNVVGSVGDVMDITETRKSQEKQARLLKRMEGLNRLQEELLAAGSLEEKFKKITDAAVDLLELDFCRIWQIKPADLCNRGCVHAAAEAQGHVCHPRDKCLHLIASSGRYTNIDGPYGRMPSSCSKIGRIANSEQKKFLTNCVVGDPEIVDHAWAESLGLVSFAGYKLHDANGAAAGVMAMFAKHPLEEEDDVFLSHLAETTSKVIKDCQAEEELRHSQKMEAVGLLAGGIAHEFNNLLQAIGGYAAYAKEGLSPGEQRHDDLQMVLDATERATALTRQLLGFSRRGVLQPKQLDADEAVRDLVKMVRPLIGAHIDLQTSFNGTGATVYADRDELQQVLLNLCVNARDAMPSGGKLLLKTEALTLQEPTWEYGFRTTPGHYVVFSVTDTGSGMSPEVRGHIFEPFFTTKGVGKGTGLGLAMVYGVVQQHLGAVHVYSELGQGTAFKIYLPRGEPAQCDEAAAQVRPAPRGTETILLAEDEPVVRHLATRLLQRSGYTVLAAADGEEALRLFDQHRAAISLVLLDAIMPKLTGHEVYSRIKQLAPETKIVFCSGYDPETAQSAFLVQEQVRLIAKPFDAQTLLGTVREVLDEPASCPLALEVIA